MNNSTFWIVFGILILIIASCNSGNENTFSVSPNDRSELAILMNDLYNDVERMKAEAKAGRAPEVKVDYRGILTASATEPDKAASQAYLSFSQSYFQAMGAVEGCESHEADSLLNSVITSCENCHGALCPGPLKKIVHLRE